MKNTVVSILLTFTLTFAAFVGGYYMGKDASGSVIEISNPTGKATRPTQAPSSVPATAPTASSAAATNNTAPSSAPTATTSPAGSDPLIDLNTATLEQLDTLPGIGPVLAQRILDYRQKIGGFKLPEELLEVEGIGEKTLEKLKDYITVGG